MKKGFTLAEVLITLGVIGVVAALTLPNLMENTTIAQIGPKLAKAVTNFEQANIALLQSYQSDALVDTGIVTNTELDVNEEYANKLSETLKISPLTEYGPFEKPYITKDGMVYSILTGGFVGDSKIKHKHQVGELGVDINGPLDPNLPATDIFYFAIMDDGSLTPYGSTLYTEVHEDKSVYWGEKCAIGAAPETPEYCSGHVFENNMKVLYK